MWQGRRWGRREWKGGGHQNPPQEGEDEDGEHERGHDHVQPVPLQGKCNNGDGYAKNGDGDEEEEPQLDHRLASQRHDALDDAGEGAQEAGLSVERGVMRHLPSVNDEEPDPPHGGNRGGNDDADPEEPPIMSSTCLSSMRRPISEPPRQTVEDHLTAEEDDGQREHDAQHPGFWPPARSRAPTREPPSTPSMTGSASTGSM